MPKKPSLANASFNQICRFTRDGTEIGDFWMTCDSYEVCITEQKKGASPTQGITIPRAKFNRLIAAYQKPRRLLRK